MRPGKDKIEGYIGKPVPLTPTLIGIFLLNQHYSRLGSLDPVDHFDIGHSSTFDGISRGGRATFCEGERGDRVSPPLLSRGNLPIDQLRYGQNGYNPTEVLASYTKLRRLILNARNEIEDREKEKRCLRATKVFDQEIESSSKGSPGKTTSENLVSPQKRHNFSADLKRNFDILLKSADEDFPLQSLKNLLMPDERIGDWGLPSHGSAKKTCGSFFRKICPNPDCHPDGLKVFKSKIKRCFSPKCPVCWGAWAKREAGRIEYRIRQAQKLYPSLGRPIHVVASVPSWDYGLNPSEMRKKAYKIVKKAGFVGGSGIFHSFRQDPNSGLWFYSAHFHFIGFGWISGSARIYKSKGWIVKNLGVRDNVFGTAFYQLTHCSVWYGVGRKHSVTWMGSLAYNQLGIPKRPKRVDRCCYCGEEMKTVIWDGEGDPPLPCRGLDGFYLAKADHWITREEAFWMAINPFKNDVDPEFNCDFNMASLNSNGWVMTNGFD